MRKQTILLVILIVFVFLLSACKSINYGTVIKKEYTSARSIYQPMIMHVNKTTRIIPRWMHQSERWKILVENQEGQEWWSVTEDYYNKVQTGDYVDRRSEADRAR